MKKGRFLFLAIGLLFISTFSFGQFDKASVQEILNELKPADFQWVGVTLEVVGTSEIEDKSYKFDSGTIGFIYKEKYFIIKDGKGRTINVPYENVKAIRAFPRSEKYLSTIDIYIK